MLEWKRHCASMTETQSTLSLQTGMPANGYDYSISVVDPSAKIQGEYEVPRYIFLSDCQSIV